MNGRVAVAFDSKIAPTEGRILDPQGTIDHFIFVLAGADDKLSSCLASTAYFLGQYPGWQREIREGGRVRKPWANWRPRIDFRYRGQARLGSGQ